MSQILGPSGHLEAWLQHLVAVRGRAPATVDRYRRMVERMCADLDIADPAAVTSADLDRHLRNLYIAGMSRSTMHGTVAAMRSFFDYLAIVGVVEESPARRLQGPRPYVREAPHLTVAEVRRLIEGSRPGTLPQDPLAARNAALLAVSYAAGLRVSEPGRLRADELGWDEERGRYSLLISAAKLSETDVRVTLFDPFASRLLGAFLPLRGEIGPSNPWLFPSSRGGQLHRRWVSEIFHDRVRAVELKPRGRRLTFHILRHSLATHLHQAGWPPKAIQESMRHKDFKTTTRYVHTPDDAIARYWRKKHPLRQRRRPSVDLQQTGRELLRDLQAAISPE